MSKNGVSFRGISPAILLVVMGTTVVLSVASIPWRVCHESLTRAPALTRFYLPGALCAYLAALAGIAVAGSTALGG
jgi:hypothetical protein